MGFKAQRARRIDAKILEVLGRKKQPVSTREIALSAGVTWHTVESHCLRLQLSGRIDGFRISNINVWVRKK